MRLMTYNVHGGVGGDGRRALGRIVRTIVEWDPDVVALQELDRERPRSARVHQARVIAEELTMSFHFHPAVRLAEEEYGDAILSKYPMRLRQAGRLPWVDGLFFSESRGALWVEVLIEGTPWQVMNTHFGLGRAERLAQARALLGPEWVGATPGEAPLIVCGDLNSQPGGRVYRLFSSVLRDAQSGRCGKTFPARFPLLSIDHIFVGTGVGIQEARPLRTALSRVASDHLPLCAELSLE
jgi:endonuclease/exonuclease/phosphatase family metal-dependent hydrolase